LLFIYIPIKRPKDKPVLSKKILYSYRQKELIFYYHYWIYSINMLKIIAMLLIRIKIQILPATIYDYYAHCERPKGARQSAVASEAWQSRTIKFNPYKLYGRILIQA